MQRHYHFRIFYALISLVLFVCACGKSPETNATPRMFSLMPATETGVDFRNEVPEQAKNGTNIIQYLYYYNGGGVAAGYLNSDSLPDLYFTSNMGEDALYLNRGHFRFEKIQLPYPLDLSSKWTTGVTCADVNGDGREDIYVCAIGQYKQLKGRNLLYINQGDDPDGRPIFQEQAEQFGLALSAFSTQSAFFDYDRDGDLDCFVLCHSVHSAGAYRDTAQTRKFDPLAADRLYRNDGNGHFTDVSQPMGIYGGIAGYGLGLSISDLNGDGWPDIYVGNDFHESDYLYINQNGRGFKELGTSAFAHTSNFTMGSDAADLNNDGRIDLFTLDMQAPDQYTRKASQPVDQLDIFQYKHGLGYHYQYPRNMLQLNLGNTSEGQPLFAEVGQLHGIDATDWSWSTLLADFDLDGYKDIFITNGIRRRGNNMDFLKYTSSGQVQASATDVEILSHMPEGHAPNYAYQNVQADHFRNVSKAWGLDLDGYSNGAAYADLDADGDLDLIVNNINAPASVYRNEQTNQARLKIVLDGPTKNHLALGAKVTVRGAEWTQTFEIQSTRGFQSASEPLVLCGWPKATDVQVSVKWPDGSQSETLSVQLEGLKTMRFAYRDAPKNAPHPIAETAKTGLLHVVGERNLPKQSEAEKTAPSTAISEKLVPWLNHENSTRLYPSIKQPQLVVRSGKNPQIIDLQTNKSRPLDASRPSPEITAAAFCDIDGDGKEEILAGATGLVVGNALLIYRQNRSGDYRLDTSKMILTDQISVIRPADIDRDGDLDVFVGCAAKSGAYGMTPTSHLLINDGKGKFGTSDERALDGMTSTGMITDAVWADMNGDQTLDLVVCGEWMPITIFYQIEGKFRQEPIDNSAGWWQSLLVTDLNADGRPDLLAGNLGENTRLKVSSQYPARLYVGDFDQNGMTDPLVTYVHEGVEHLLVDRDLLATQIPSIKKQFPGYDQFAKSNFQEIFPHTEPPSTTIRKAEVAASAAFIQLTSNRFALEKLPKEVQFSSVHTSLALSEQGGYLMAGNLFAVQPYLGRLDAAPIWLCKRSADGIWEAEPWPDTPLNRVREYRSLHAWNGKIWTE